MDQERSLDKYDGIIVIRHGNFLSIAYCSREQSENKYWKSECQSIPENHNTNEKNSELNVSNDIAPINTQENNHVSAITDKFAVIDINYSHIKQIIPKIRKGQIVEFTVENVSYKVEVLSTAVKATGRY